MKTDWSRIIFTVDRGVAMVVMDRQDYINKAQELIGNQDNDRPISKDPNPKLKIQLIQLLKDCKSHGQIHQAAYKRVYPACVALTKFYGSPKVHKKAPP